MKISEHISQLAKSESPNSVVAIERMFLTESFGLLFEGMPEGKQSGETIDASGLKLQLVADPQGKRMIKACADPEVFAKNYPNSFNGTMTGMQIMQMIEKSPDIDGILICSATSFNSYAFHREELKRIRSFNRAENENMIEVPEGHKVVVISGTVNPQFGQAESGLFVANLGYGPKSWKIIEEAKSRPDEYKQFGVMWIVQQESFGGLDQLDKEKLKAELTGVLEEEKETTHIAVFVSPADQNRSLVNIFRILGMGVHHSAPDGACLIEVHKPDGQIIIGMAGEAIKDK